VLASLAEIDKEAQACRVPSIDQTHRKHPDQIATERRQPIPHWIFRDAPPRPNEVHSGETEEALRATIDSAGNPIKPAGVRYGRFGQIITPQIEMREVVSRTQFRPGSYAPALSEVRLPPAFADNSGWHWPRS
jgi:hypothetical protein